MRFAFPYIKPFESFLLIGRFIKWIYDMFMIPARATARFSVRTLTFIFNMIGKFLVFLRDMLTHIGIYLYRGIKWVCTKLFSGGRKLCKLLLIPIKFINDTYFWLFKFLLVQLKAIGIVGELIFTLFGLVWLLWPMGLAYYFGKIEIYIPAIILCAILIV